MTGVPLHHGQTAANRADRLFFGAGDAVAANDPTCADGTARGVSYALTGPSPSFAPGHVPVRGDLAHIAMAGKWFVPHYAVPMPHRVRNAGTTLMQAPGNGAEVLEQLAAGARFDVLEISGGWCWGQAGEGGFVGYVAQAALDPA